MVPIWVSDPTGVARPRRASMTPAIAVVATAPRPGRRTARRPSAGAIVAGFFNGSSGGMNEVEELGRAALGAVARQGSLSCAASERTEIAGERVDDIVRVSDDDHFVAGIEESIEAIPAVAHDGR